MKKETINAKVLLQIRSQTLRHGARKAGRRTASHTESFRCEGRIPAIESVGLLLALSLFFSGAVHAQQMTTIDGQTSPTLQSGSQPNQLFNPNGVGVDPCGNVFVADTANRGWSPLDFMGRVHRPS